MIRCETQGPADMWYTIKSTIDTSRMTTEEISIITGILSRHYDDDGILITAGNRMQLAVIKK